ncbi:MAG: iron ABC transporter permease [Aeromicrobium sp.]|uniref:FecCD family ABC transporter permease n=1 Tax=Aeromicrobium sp. TaxID=1871063 RepID=UPI0039E42A02
MSAVVARVRRRRRVRALVTTTTLTALVVTLFIVTLSIGSMPLSAGQIVGALVGLDTGPGVDYVVRDLRLPTAATALGVGLAMGLSGIVFQRLLANPLASPDFVGVSAGASFAAVLAIVVLGLAGPWVCLAALVGAVTAATLIYLLAWRDGVSGYRFILVGIGVLQFFTAGSGYVLSRATRYEAREAMTWMVGGVGQAGAFELRLLWVGIALVVPVVLVLTRHLATLELGDDTATALGAPVQAMRLALTLAAVALVALATATAGPMAFVALIAGPIALRLVGVGGPALPASALVGAVIVLTADLVAVHAFPAQLPTGVVTGAIGAPYLIWLLVSTNREGRGG